MDGGGQNSLKRLGFGRRGTGANECGRAMNARWIARPVLVGAGLRVGTHAALIEPTSLDDNLFSWFAEAGIP